MAESRRFSTATLVITTMAVLVTTLALVIWLPTPEELAQRRAVEAYRRAYAELSQVHIGPIRWSEVTLEEAVADVNARLEKKGETDLRLFVSKDYAYMGSGTISMDLPDLSVTECVLYLSDLSLARMSGSQEGLTFEPLRCDMPIGDMPWRIRVRHWVERNLWGRWGTDLFAPALGSSAPAPSATPPAPLGPSPAPPPGGGADPFAPAAAP